ncbi:MULTISPECIES: hypothetical protein [Vreelandella]|nr:MULTISPECIES: hypothetical protein [Halomonas]
MYTAQRTQPTQAKPLPVAGALLSASVYAAYWFSHGVPLADQ